MSVRRIFFSEEVWFSFWQKKRYIWKCKFAAKKSLVLWLKQWWVVKQQTLLLGFSKSIPSRVSKTLNFGDSLTQPKIFMFIGFTKKWAHVIKKKYLSTPNITKFGDSCCQSPFNVILILLSLPFLFSKKGNNLKCDKI